MNPILTDDDALIEPEEIGPATTLEEFLALPEIDESPAWEFVDGRMVRKVSPKYRHSVMTRGFLEAIEAFAGPRQIGEALPELRCTFGGKSIVPDVVFLLAEHIEYDEFGDPLDDITRAPDLIIEIVSPGQSMRKLEEQILHALSNGCALGWLVHTYRETIGLYLTGNATLILGLDDVLTGEPVLPGFQLRVSEVFGWLKRRRGGRR
jgi:Uma2 family endonuclease